MSTGRNRNKIAVLYGSETGNAQDFATILSHKLQRLHFDNILSSIGDFNPNDILKVKYVFFIVSTTGQGELPRNVHETSNGDKITNKQTLWNILKRKNVPQDFLNHLNVAFLGLGDSSYPQFNFGIRKLHNRIVKQLGAKEILERMEADEQCMAGSNKGTGAGIEEVYFAFERQVVKYLMEKFPKMLDPEDPLKKRWISRSEIDKSIYMEPKSSLKLDDDELLFDLPKIEFINDNSVQYGKVISKKRLTADDHFQDVEQFIFTKINKSNTEQIVPDEYYCGDTVALYASNSDEDVNDFLESQSHWLPNIDKPLTFTNGMPKEIANISGGLVKPLTLRNLLKYHIDLNGIPRSSFFMKIWTFATDVTRMERGEEQLNDQRDKLKEFGYDEDMQGVFDYCNRPRRSIVEVLNDFLSVRLPWELCLDYLPLIRPRYYSISSESMNPNIELTIAIVKYKTILKKIREGVCTKFVNNLDNGEVIRYKIQNNNLLPKKNLVDDKPMVLVGPGVGIAPLMSIVKNKPEPLSSNIQLIYGCRFKDKDYLYQDILEELHAKGKINLLPVFSRDRENSPTTKYVQDVMWEEGKYMTKLLLDQNGIFYLCGSSGRMPLQVRITLVEMFKKWGKFKDDNEVKSYLKEMERDGRYIQETW